MDRDAKVMIRDCAVCQVNDKVLYTVDSSIRIPCSWFSYPSDAG